MLTHETEGMLDSQAFVALKDGAVLVNIARGEIIDEPAMLKRADLVLLQGNPLQDITNTSKIGGVLIGGRWFPRAEIQRRLDSGR